MGIRFLDITQPFVSQSGLNFNGNLRDYYLLIDFKEFWFWALIGEISREMAPKGAKVKIEKSAQNNSCQIYLRS